jgi:hypothetical protein
VPSRKSIRVTARVGSHAAIWLPHAGWIAASLSTLATTACTHYLESRVGIDFKRKGYGSEGYALGEMVAEMARSFWAADPGATVG